MALSIDCASDTRDDLRALAKSDDDLVVVADLKAPPRGERIRDLTRDLVAETHADQSTGMTLGESFTRIFQQNSVGLYPPHEAGADFDGELTAVDDSLVLVLSADGVSTSANAWQKFIAGALGTVVGILTTTVCPLAFKMWARRRRLRCVEPSEGLSAHSATSCSKPTSTADRSGTARYGARRWPPSCGPRSRVPSAGRCWRTPPGAPPT
ncbi:hypothetical protein [Streptomyces sp. SP18CS02]|uniref:hypothetical protein n=1 Tax=Streptomyces sp. SP18CS02 TaxID=3002531 RepID=UPI002E793464|nr:hypothetical protein [Streptomyces sp. SP18CS02]MEE1752698.1 hypothetical protein [Streptomyces sp. SP18CS02]